MNSIILVFGMVDYEAYGGFGDYISHASSLEDAKEKIEDDFNKGYWRNEYQVVRVDDKGYEVIAEYRPDEDFLDGKINPDWRNKK